MVVPCPERLRTRRLLSLILLVPAAIFCCSCATGGNDLTLAEKDRFDRFNRVSYKTHSVLDRYIIKPVATGYDALPNRLKRRFSNFFDNLHGPIDISNNLLQGKFKRGFSGIGRLLVNSTIGLGGIFDPASRMGMPSYREDFGQTLATWGVPSGPYIFLPIVGPSTARDVVGRIFDWQIDPVVQMDDNSTRNALVAAREIERRADYLSELSEGAMSRSRDEFLFVLSNYAQSRERDIYDGNPPRLDDADFE